MKPCIVKSRSVFSILLLAVVFAVLGVAGCGGAKNPTSPARTASGGATGRATLTITWPDATTSRLIPARSNSILVEVLRGGTVVDSRLVPRPGDTSVPTVVTFDRVPVDTLLLKATAYPNADGTGVAQASGTSSVTVTSNATAATNVVMNTTVDHIDIAPIGPLGLTVGGTATLTATARDAGGAMVLLSPAKTSWASNHPAATVDAAGLVKAVSAGVAQLTFSDSESGKSASITVNVSPAPVPGDVRRLSLMTSDLVYNAETGQIIASLPSSADPFNGNTVCSINPNSLVVSGFIPVGSEPGKLALADNNRDLYVALNGTAAVRHVHLDTGVADAPFGLGFYRNTSLPLYAEDMAVMPGNPTVLAVSRKIGQGSPLHCGVVIYDNGVPRSVTTAEGEGSNVIEWGVGGRIYGLNTESSEWGFRRMEVTASGVRIVDVTTGLITGSYAYDIAYENGRIYATTGVVLDAEARTRLASTGVYGVFCADSALKRFWVVSLPTGGEYTVRAFSTETFQQVGSQTILGDTGAPTSLIRWGNSGLAFRTPRGVVYIIPFAPGL